jgi:hypothetical protein
VLITTDRKARKEHSCWRCGESIRPGETYRELKLTPDDAEVGTGRWQRLAEHASIGTCHVNVVEGDPDAPH